MNKPPDTFFSAYSTRLQSVLNTADWSQVELLADELLKCWKNNQQVFLCGNGGSAANALHIANDFLYGTAMESGAGIRTSALSANAAVMTCLGNDLGYDKIFSEQLAVQAQADDILIVLSGSGNSPNIISCLKQAKSMQVKTYAILGFSGGECKTLADVAIHFPIEDMQIAEDIQLIIGHMLMQWLFANRPKKRMAK